MGSLMYEPKTFSAISASDLSAYEYVFVKFSSGSTDDKKIIEIAASGVPCGILVKGEVAGRLMQVIPLNGQPAKLMASAAIAIDDTVTLTTGGKGVTTTSDGARYYFVATEAATDDEDIITGYTCNGFRGA